jgi:hypothetical protein
LHTVRCDRRDIFQNFFIGGGFCMLKMIHLQARFLTIEDRVVHLARQMSLLVVPVGGDFVVELLSQDFRNRDCLESLFMRSM